MRHFAFAAAIVLVATPAFASDKTEVLKPVHAFVDGLDKGDMKLAASAFAPQLDIIDEFPPHHWSGASAFADWGADFGKDSAAHGDTEAKLTMHKLHRIKIEGDHAYAVIPTDFSYKEKGKTIVEHGTITYAIDKTADGWKIASWSYSW
jgi:hypothetical protein